MSVSCDCFGNKVALVTGASRGIGRAVALALARRGCVVAFTFRKRSKEANEVLTLFDRAGVRGRAFEADAADYSRARAVVEEVRKCFGGLDLLVNNAGIVRDRLLVGMREEDWHEVLATNLTGTFNFCRAAIASMMKSRAGRILNISSVSGVRGMPGQTNYSAAKAGVIGLTKALAREVAPLNIAVNALALGFIETDMTRELSLAHRERLLNVIPMRRFGQPEEVAEVACFLLSSRVQYMTGAVVHLDGGMAA